MCIIVFVYLFVFFPQKFSRTINGWRLCSLYTLCPRCTYRLGSCVLFCLFICFVFVCCCFSSKMQRNCWWMVSMSATHRLLVADLDRDHELLHRHHVHRHEVVLEILFWQKQQKKSTTKEMNNKQKWQQHLESWYTHWFLIVTPVELKPQERLSLRKKQKHLRLKKQFAISKIQQHLEDGVFKVCLHPLHPLNALGASVPVTTSGRKIPLISMFYYFKIGLVYWISHYNSLFGWQAPRDMQRCSAPSTT